MLSPTSLAVEYTATVTAPLVLAVSTPVPRVSWKLMATQANVTQSAYSITAVDAVTGAMLWSTGKVASNQTVHVEWAGAALASEQRVQWSLTVWDQLGGASAPASAAFEVALLAPADWRGALWISSQQQYPPKNECSVRIPRACLD